MESNAHEGMKSEAIHAGLLACVAQHAVQFVLIDAEHLPDVALGAFEDVLALLARATAHQGGENDARFVGDDAPLGTLFTSEAA